MAYWIYKCNSRGIWRDRGDWNHVFEQGSVVRWGGTDLHPDLERLKPGDTLLAYQTDRNELVGTARVVGLRPARGKKHVFIQPVRRIGAKVKPLKAADPRVATIPALQGGRIAALYTITDRDAIHLIRAATDSRQRLVPDDAADKISTVNPPRAAESAAAAFERERLASQGFRVDPKLRRAIERHALRRAIRHYSRRGFAVTEHGKPFDLLCKVKRRTLFVEVKGTETRGADIILTPREVQFSASNPMELFVLRSVRVLNGGGRSRVRGGTPRIIRPWRPTPSQLTPIAYSVSLESS